MIHKPEDLPPTVREFIRWCDERARFPDPGPQRQNPIKRGDIPERFQVAASVCRDRGLLRSAGGDGYFLSAEGWLVANELRATSEALRTADAGEPSGNPPRPIRAGEAFMRMAEQDPEARAALERLQERMRAVAEIFQSAEFRHALDRDRREQQERLEKLAEQIRKAMHAAGDELTARGFSAPQTLEDWEHLARIVEMPFETTRSGDYTLRDVYVMALSWVERQQLRERLARQASPITDAPKTSASKDSQAAPPKYTVAALREMTALGNTALNEYAKKAGVATPGRGQKNFRYSATDVQKILRTIIEQTTETRILERCRDSLANLETTD